MRELANVCGYHKGLGEPNIRPSTVPKNHLHQKVEEAFFLYRVSQHPSFPHRKKNQNRRVLYLCEALLKCTLKSSAVPPGPGGYSPP